MIGGGIARGLMRKAAMAGAAAGAALVALFALGAAIYFALCMVVVPLAAAAITALIFAVVAGLLLFAVSGGGREDDADEEEVGMGQRAFMLFRERPILGTVAALAGGWIFLRNPALATMVAAAFTERSHGRERGRRRR